MVSKDEAISPSDVVVVIQDVEREYDAIGHGEELAARFRCPGRVLILTSTAGGRERYLSQLRDLASLDAHMDRGRRRLRVEQRTARSVPAALDEIVAELGPRAVLVSSTTAEGVDLKTTDAATGYDAMSA